MEKEGVQVPRCQHVEQDAMMPLRPVTALSFLG